MAATSVAIPQATKRPRARRLQVRIAAAIRHTLPAGLWYPAACALAWISRPFITLSPTALDNGHTIIGIRSWLQALSDQTHSVPIPIQFQRPPAPELSHPDRSFVLVSGHFIANFWFLRWLHDRGWEIGAIARPQPAGVLGCPAEMHFLPADSSAFLQAREWLRRPRRILLVFIEDTEHTLTHGPAQVVAINHVFSFAYRMRAPVVAFRASGSLTGRVRVHLSDQLEPGRSKSAFVADCERQFEQTLKRAGIPVEWQRTAVQ